jgi:hypothetical protein
MVWALFRVALFGGSFLIGLYFLGPAAPVHAKNETAISVSHKKHKRDLINSQFSILIREESQSVLFPRMRIGN